MAGMMRGQARASAILVAVCLIPESVTHQLPLWSEPQASWKVRESHRARRMVVRVFHTGRVEVVVPTRTSTRAIQTFIERHRPWIERKREEARLKAVAPAPFPPAAIELSACREQWRVQLCGGTGRARIAPRGEGLLALTGDPGNRQLVRQALRSWLTERARGVLAPWLADCARELGFDFERVEIRRQRTRWGSCSMRGTISLNCCLLFQPPPVVRYLMIHELAHTRHMNHSRHFWHCVGRCCPEYRELDRQLLEGWRAVPQWVFAEDLT